MQHSHSEWKSRGSGKKFSYLTEAALNKLLRTGQNTDALSLLNPLFSLWSSVYKTSAL